MTRRSAGMRSAAVSWLLVSAVTMQCANGYEPRINYMLNCMGCHGPDGSGAPGKVPSLRDTLVPFAKVPAGRRYLVQVPGTAQSALSDREVAQLLNWMVRNLSEHPATRRPADFTPAEVTSYRSGRLADPSAARTQLLLQAVAACGAGKAVSDSAACAAAGG